MNFQTETFGRKQFDFFFFLIFCRQIVKTNKDSSLLVVVKLFICPKTERNFFVVFEFVEKLIKILPINPIFLHLLLLDAFTKPYCEFQGFRS